MGRNAAQRVAGAGSCRAARCRARQRRNRLSIYPSSSTTSPAASSGSSSVSTTPPTAAVFSTVASTGLARPPVVAVEAPRSSAVPVCTSPAVPPPTNTPSVQRRVGSRWGEGRGHQNGARNEGRRCGDGVEQVVEKRHVVARNFGHRGRGQRDERGPGTQPRKPGRRREVASAVGQAGRQQRHKYPEAAARRQPQAQRARYYVLHGRPGFYHGV